jgi:hypothetical protein
MGAAEGACALDAMATNTVNKTSRFMPNTLS